MSSKNFTPSLSIELFHVSSPLLWSKKRETRTWINVALFSTFNFIFSSILSISSFPFWPIYVLCVFSEPRMDETHLFHFCPCTYTFPYSPSEFPVHHAYFICFGILVFVIIGMIVTVPSFSDNTIKSLIETWLNYLCQERPSNSHKCSRNVSGLTLHQRYRNNMLVVQTIRICSDSTSHLVLWMTLFRNANTEKLYSRNNL